MNTDKARFNMIEQQIRPWQVSDAQILNLMATTPREMFVPEPYRALAFADMSIPLGHHQSMYAPREEARMLQAVYLSKQDEVLEIGTGSGFTAALMASIAKSVKSIDCYGEFIERAEQRLGKLGLANVVLAEEQAEQNWSPQDDFDVIVCTPGINFKPLKLLDSLRPNGRLFCIHGIQSNQYAYLYKKDAQNDIHMERLFELSTPLLSTEHELQLFEF
ncbi:MAG: protein-L-isoaspartate O-methyltransferase [Gammaproteobacteria bacterium]|nr:protein-L-isoaspartate O-methyltransferase [Gammaproteobacteria bacterium]NVK89098.1 protein-L-isoaspartate O-methyltransferase [Gammaproteobacteria bacterium]